MPTGRKIFDIALDQSAIDMNCRAEDFLRAKNRVVLSAAHPDARKYLALPFSLCLVSYGCNIVASVSPGLEAETAAYIEKHPRERGFETPNLIELNELLQKRGMRLSHMAQYYLPDPGALNAPECGLETRLLYPADFAGLYEGAWRNALCEKRRHLDVLGVGAYDEGMLAGLAACSADCETMWQIGVDVLPEYRRRGVARALTGRLAMEILGRGKVPFYGASWANVGSARNAAASGFRPAWVELSASPAEEIAGTEITKG